MAIYDGQGHLIDEQCLDDRRHLSRHCYPFYCIFVCTPELRLAGRCSALQKMNNLKIDLQKSLSFGKLYYRKSVFEKIWQHSIILANLSFFLFITGTNLYENIDKSKPFGWTLFFFILCIIITTFGMFSLLKSNNLDRINGLSEFENERIVKKIADQNNWKIDTRNNGLDVINISFLDTQTDYGKQMIVLYDQNDILINCISFALGKTPNPFNWFSNKKMNKKFKTEFEKIKTHYNNV